MVALSEDSSLLSRLFQHRFTGDGDLSGHSFGNLFLAALSEVTGDFAEAIRLSSEILASKGHIYPATDSDVRIAAELEDGSIVQGETKVGKVGNSIKRLFLEPENCSPMPDALKAIESADMVNAPFWVISRAPLSVYETPTALPLFGSTRAPNASCRFHVPTRSAKVRTRVSPPRPGCAISNASTRTPETGSPVSAASRRSPSTIAAWLDVRSSLS